MKKKLFGYAGMGILMIVIFNVVLFMTSLLFSFESEGPSLPASLVFACAMGLITSLIIFMQRPKSRIESLGYSVTWTGITFIEMLITTVANDTTSIFFGSWFNYLVFVAMDCAPLAVPQTKSSSAK